MLYCRLSFNFMSIYKIVRLYAILFCLFVSLISYLLWAVFPLFFFLPLYRSRYRTLPPPCLPSRRGTGAPTGCGTHSSAPRIELSVNCKHPLNYTAMSVPYFVFLFGRDWTRYIGHALWGYWKFSNEVTLAAWEEKWIREKKRKGIEKRRNCIKRDKRL